MRKYEEHTALINVGLTGKAGEIIDILHAADQCGLIAHRWTVCEGTAAIEIEPQSLNVSVAKLVYELCVKLDRDCIPLKTDEHSYMCGPKRDKYGPFDESKFKKIERVVS